MDGIPSSLSSVTPILPETSLIGEAGGIKGPTVEIAPLPDNSFGSDSATAELLNNAFTLSLEIKGYNDPNGEKNIGKQGSTLPGGTSSGRAAPDGTAVPGDAYTLSLSVGDDVPAASEMARELLQMKNYERLGKAVTRQTFRMNTDTGSVEHEASQAGGGKAADQLGDTIRYLQARFASERGQFIQQEMIQPATDGSSGSPGGPDLDDPAPPQPGQSRPPQTPQSTFNRPLAFQLTPSDYEAILTLEPDLQEALLNMLGAGDVTAPPGRAGADTAKMTVQTAPFPAQDTAGENPGAPLRSAGTPAQGAGTLTQGIGTPAQGIETPVQGAGGTPVHGVGTPAQGIGAPVQGAGTPVQGSADEDALAALLNRAATAAQTGAQDLQVRFTPHGPGTAAQAPRTPDAAGGAPVFTAPAEDRAGGLLSAALAGVAARNAPAAGLMNLQKITELPYSLYLFESAAPEPRSRSDEEEELAVREKPAGRTYGPSEFLRLSEVVKAACILHNMYHGGSGLFLEETPWYQPYVQYALKHGIIQNGEFDDFSEYATRAETAYIFSGSVPKAEFPVINYVLDLADVDENTGYGDYIYLLMRAGVLLLNDKKGRFYPESMITRAEAAAIAGRIATPGDRKRS
jgi:hypothetical protein